MASPKRLSLNVCFDKLDESRQKAITEDFPNYKEDFVTGNPGRFIATPRYAERAEDIYNLEVRPDDYWLVTFPKCGTNWMQELIWLVGNICDFETAKQTQQNKRSHFVEMSLIGPARTSVDHKPPGGTIASPFLPLDELPNLPSPRFLKTHLPFYLLPPSLLDTAKVVYVARNPKDVIVSYFHHHKLIKFMNFSKDLEEFAEYFMRDEVMFSPYFAHILEAWNKRHHPNLLFIFYEDMKADLGGQIKKVANFFNKPVSDENLAKMVDHLRFDNFSKNESVNMEHGKKMGIFNTTGNFIRKGKTGDWKNHFSPELNARIDQWIEKNMEGTDLKFITELEHQD